jgi:hypothetical protein
MPSDDDHDWIVVTATSLTTRSVCRICGADKSTNHLTYSVYSGIDLPCFLMAEITRSHRFYIPGDLSSTISCYIECIDCGEGASWVLVNPPKNSEAWQKQRDINGTHILCFQYPIAKCSTVRMQKALG